MSNGITVNKTTITADGTTPPIVIQNLDIRPITRQNQDAISWRNATRAAEGIVPRRVLLYNLYADIKMDGHVLAVMGKREDEVINAKWHYVDKDGQPVDEINNMIDTLGFQTMIKEIHNSHMWGYTMGVCEFVKDDDGNYELIFSLIDRRHMRPETGIVANEMYGDTGINIREGYYTGEVLEAGDPKNLGLLISAGYYYVLKRGNIGDLATFVEVFGQGIIDATWNGYDSDQRKKLSDSLKNIGNGGVIVRPDGTNVQLLENKSTSDGKLHTAALDFYNLEISKALLGTTETTQASKSSGYAQSQSHQQDDDEKNDGDINFVRRVLNSRFRKIMKAQGIDTKGGKFIVQPEEKKLSKKDAYEIYRSMCADLDIPISDDFFYETFGVDKPDDYNTLKAALETKKAQNAVQTNPNTLEDSAATPPPSGDKNDKKPPVDDGKSGKQPTGRMAKLRDAFNMYTHFFG